MKKTIAIVAVLALVGLCLGLATCEKSDPRKASSSTRKPVTPPSKWVGRWVNTKGNNSYIIDAEKSGHLYGWYINAGGKREKCTMRLINEATAAWTTPIGVEMRFTRHADNRITMSAAGMSATILRIVK